MLLACRQALIELDLEGGPANRLERYALNHEIVRKGLMQMGFRQLVANEQEQSKILNSFLYPSSPKIKFSFDEFYSRLSQKRMFSKILKISLNFFLKYFFILYKGMIIYPGKVSKAPCFRIGNIG